jgi:hypothetical protein
MRGLGFSSYVAQGGDIGSFVTQLLAQNFDACKGESTTAFSSISRIEMVARI